MTADMMSKKDYTAIAAIVASMVGGQRDYVAHKLADIMQRDNPRLDRARFLTACGVTP
jgi:hypothetical protein